MLTQIEGAFAEKSASEERLRQFVADASHELRTPADLHPGLRRAARAGAASPTRPARRKALKRIEEEATRMGGLVEDLLLLAELDRGRPLRAEPVDLHRICADAVDDSNAVPTSHHLTLSPGRPVVVIGDAERLAQVAHNLVRNALAHTPAGTEVTVSTGGPRAAWGTSGCPTTARASRPTRPPASSTASTRATPVPVRPGHRAGPGHRARHRRGALDGTAEVGVPPRAGATLRRPDPACAGVGGAPGAHVGDPARVDRRARYRSCTEAPGTTASSTGRQLDVGLGRLGLGIRVGHDARAGPQRDRRARRVEPGAADADHPLPVAVGVDPPTGPAQ